MASDFEWGKTQLEKLIAWHAEQAPEADKNEATTRLHLIDRLLFECLGWAREDCVAEETHEGTYTDYSLGQPFRLLVIEAKKEGIHFQLPVGTTRRVCNISTLCEQSDEVESAVRQAIQYCQDRGIAVGAVCNGHQLIAFIGSRTDGTPPIRGRALVFTSLEDMLSEFADLWTNLSKPGISAYNLHSLLKDAVPPPPAKLSQRIANYPGFKERNVLQASLKILGDLFLHDIAAHPEIEPEFVKTCYCLSGALSQYALVSKQILESRYAMMFRGEPHAPDLQPIQNKRGIAGEFASDILAASLSARPIVLLGDVGVGKTMFIKHFIHVDATEVLQKAVVLYVSFTDEPALLNDLNTFILHSCVEQLRLNYGIDPTARQFVRGVYHFDLQRFSQSYVADLREVDSSKFAEKEIEFLDSKVADEFGHLKRCLEHLSKAQKRQIVIFLDNIDQRPFEFQESAFQIANALAAKWPGTVFISLRPDTFYQSRAKGALTAYQPRVFTIAPPRTDEVLLKRLSFSLEKLSATGRLPSFPENITLQSRSLSLFLEALRQSLEQNNSLMEFIDNISSGNIRRAIDMVREFVGSGHVNTAKIISAIEAHGHYTVPVHEFIRAVLYGDHEYYDPSASLLPNCFDISTPDGKEHFLLLLILSTVERLGDMANQSGYVELPKVFDALQSLGFNSVQIKYQIEKALERGLLESSPRFSDSLASTQARISAMGAYCSKRLIASFAYIDAIVVDTPIVEVGFRAAIDDEREILQRLDRAAQFLAYLDHQWTPFSAKTLPFAWRPIAGKIRAEMERIRTSPRLAFLT
jgi:GTPase SAR1 family protein